MKNYILNNSAKTNRKNRKARKFYFGSTNDNKGKSAKSLLDQISKEKENTVKTVKKKPIKEKKPELVNNHDNKPKEISKFKELKLNKSILNALDEIGYTNPTTIQNQTIPLILDRKDVLGIAKTGSGKTAAFALPILNSLINNQTNDKNRIKTLIISPTRELALQIGENFIQYGKYTPIKVMTIFGGVSQVHQVRGLKKGCDILIATPGRLQDLIKQGIISLEFIQFLVIDEADRMLDMGFIPDIRRIVNLIPNRDQTLMFSATMPLSILKLARNFLKPNFIHVTGDLESVPLNKIEQQLFFVEQKDKIELLKDMLDKDNISRALIFSRTKYGADKLVRKLRGSQYTIEAMHGNKSQQNRQRVLDNFRNDKTQIVIATDLAARGLDVDDITHVINFDLPSEPETYIHRIGRTARAGKTGIAISFCAFEERKYIPRIEQLMGINIPRAEENPLQSVHDEPKLTVLTNVKKKKKGSFIKDQRNHSNKQNRIRNNR